MYFACTCCKYLKAKPRSRCKSNQRTQICNADLHTQGCQYLFADVREITKVGREMAKTVFFGGVLTGAGPSLRYCYRIIDQLDLTSQADPGDHSQATCLPHQPLVGPSAGFSWASLTWTWNSDHRSDQGIPPCSSHDFPQAAGYTYSN